MKRRTIAIILMLISFFVGTTVVMADIAITKDRGNALKNIGIGLSEFSELDSAVCAKLTERYGISDYKGYMVYDNGVESVISVLADGEKIGWHVVESDGNVKPYEFSVHADVFQAKDRTDKITDELQQIMQKDPTRVVRVYVWRQDIDTEQVLSTIPATVNISAYARNGEVNVQEYLKEKRSYYADAYKSYNTDFLADYFSYNTSEADVYTMYNEGSVEEVEFVSEYAPMCVLNISADQILTIAADVSVTEIGYLPNEQVVFQAAGGTEAIQGTYVRNNYGYTGSGVAVGIIDQGLIYRLEGELTDVSITNRGTGYVSSEHTTRIATIIAGKASGLAPNCTIYNAPVADTSDVLGAVEWLIEQGVSVINASIGLSESNTYTMYDMWFDHLDMNHSVSVVVAAGNEGKVNSPALSYNAITVGAYDDMNTPTDHTDDLSMEYKFDADGDGVKESHRFSAYIEPNGYAEKPDLMAPGQEIDVNGLSTKIQNNSGTSFSAPYVVGTIAQMIHANHDLASEPGLIKAILLASAWRKVSVYDFEDSFVSEYEGAGKLDAKNAIYVVNRRQYTYEYHYADSFPYTKTIQLDASESQIRVSLCWLKQCVASSDNHQSWNNITERVLSNLDLIIYGPDGSVVCSSQLESGNVEIVEFDPTVSGTYTIEVRRVGGITDVDFFYLAWW